jgi:long-chain fatty acid transport protein
MKKRKERIMMSYINRCFLVTVLVAFSSVSQTWAGGFIVYELGTPDVGLASAGYAARAEDASTLFTNPAGMARLQGSNLMLGTQAIYGDVQFDPDADTGPQDGDDGGNAVGWVPGGSLFFTRQVGENLAIGLGTFSYFGGMVDYNDNWVGRYFVQNVTLVGMTVMPAIALRINDSISIGAGLNAMYGYLEDEKAVRNLASEGDGRLTVKDREWGYGADIGMLFEMGKATRIGITYLSQVDLDFSDRPEFENIGPGLAMILEARNLTNASLDLGLKVPQSVMVSFYQELGDKFALMMNAGWQDWSEFGKVEVGVDSDNPVSLTTETNFDDTWHAALGGRFRPSKAWSLSAGVAYDSSMLESEYRTPSLPLGKAWRYGLGTQYAVSEMLKLGLGYEFIWTGDLNMDRTSLLGGRLSGEYNNVHSHVIAMNAALGF